MREEGPSHRTLWSEDSPGDVIEGLRGVIADGLVKEREALLQDRAAVDEAHIARLRRAAAAAVEAELAAKSENVQLKAELAQVLLICNRFWSGSQGPACRHSQFGRVHRR